MSASSRNSQSRNPPTVRLRYRRECRGIVGVDDEPCDLIALVGDHRVVEELRERRLRQRHLGGHPLGSAVCRDAGELVPGAPRRRLGEQLLEVGKPVGRPVERVHKAH